MRRTVVVELVAPQDEGKEDGIQRPFLLDYEGADDQEARGDVYPVEILARKQGVGHVDGFFVGYWAGGLLLPQQTSNSRQRDDRGE